MKFMNVLPVPWIEIPVGGHATLQLDYTDSCFSQLLSGLGDINTRKIKALLTKIGNESTIP